MGASQDELIPTYISIGSDPDEEDSAGRFHFSREDNYPRVSHLRDKDKEEGVVKKVTQVAAGAYHNLVLTADGSMWSWGYNACIQLTQCSSPLCAFLRYEFF